MPSSSPREGSRVLLAVTTRRLSSCVSNYIAHARTPTVSAQAEDEPAMVDAGSQRRVADLAVFGARQVPHRDEPAVARRDARARTCRASIASRQSFQFALVLQHRAGHLEDRDDAGLVAGALHHGSAADRRHVHCGRLDVVRRMLLAAATRACRSCGRERRGSLAHPDSRCRPFAGSPGHRTHPRFPASASSNRSSLPASARGSPRRLPARASTRPRRWRCRCPRRARDARRPRGPCASMRAGSWLSVTVAHSVSSAMP